MAGRCLIMAVKHYIALQDRFNQLPIKQFAGCSCRYTITRKIYEQPEQQHYARLFDMSRYEILLHLLKPAQLHLADEIWLLTVLISILNFIETSSTMYLCVNK